jgi:hypothetical protein
LCGCGSLLVGCATGSDVDASNGGNHGDTSVVDVGAGDVVGESGEAGDASGDVTRDAADATSDTHDAAPSDATEASADSEIDSGIVDTGAGIDTAPIDSGTLDTGVFDTGTIDTGHDAGTIDTGHDTGPVDTGPPCVPGTPCASGDPCKIAAITCTPGGPLCAITGKVADGTGCGTGMVCSSGACTPCAAGTSCTSSGPCKTATIDCSTGAPVCTDTGSVPDGTSCGGSLVCTGGVCGCASGKTNCSGTCVDTKTDPSHCGSCTTTCSTGSTCVGGGCVASSVTLNFPTSSDSWNTAVYPAYYFWTAGDWVQGSRATSLPTATHVSIHINVMYNGLTCDNQDMRMLINGVEVGRFSITPGIATLDTSFTFAVATGTSYTLRYETVRTVASGCGAASFGPGGSPTPTGSTVTLSP